MATANLPAEQKRPLTIREQLRSPALVEQIRMALPKHMKPERMVRIALTAMTRTPELANCDQQSFFRCLLDLSQWGLEPDGRHAHLIPYRNNKRGITECQLIFDFKGLVQLCYRAGFVRSIHADIVRAGDIFVYNCGDVTQHTPWYLHTDDAKPAEAGEMIAVYCRVELKDGAIKCEAMPKSDVDSIRGRSKAKSSGPWVTDYSEMAKKTVFRRVTKWLPISAEIVDAFDRDDDRLEEPVRTVPPKSLDDLADRLMGKTNGDDVEETTDDAGEGVDETGDDNPSQLTDEERQELAQQSLLNK